MLLAGCAVPPPPAAPTARLAPDLGALRHRGVALDQPLSLAAITALALRNNPDLLAARAQAIAARDAARAAALPPEPQISLAFTPVLAGPGSVAGWSAGLMADLQALLALPTRRAAAHAAIRQVDATLLWQAWQTAGAARLLAVRIASGRQAIRLQTRLAATWGRADAASRAALSAGLIAAPQAINATDAAQNAADALVGLRADQLAARHQLNALLGLAPGVRLSLAPPSPAWMDAAARKALLRDLAARRPDIAGLRAATELASAQARGAALARLPLLSLGGTAASDTSNVRTLGPQLGLELPIFGTATAQVKAASASVRAVRAAWRARLLAARGQARALDAEIAALRHALAAAASKPAHLAMLAQAAGPAAQAGLVSDAVADDLAARRIAAQLRLAGLQSRLDGLLEAFATATGAGLPPLHPVLEPHL